MSNYYHLVVNVNRRQALDWSDDEVIERWYQLYNGHVLVDRYLNGEQLDKASVLFFDRRKIGQAHFFAKSIVSTTVFIYSLTGVAMYDPGKKKAY